MNSVDFKLKITTESGQGILQKKIGLLYVGGHEPPLAQIKITKHIKDLDGKIIECKFEKNQWVFMRERLDKSYPNSYNTAMGELLSYSATFNPILNGECRFWSLFDLAVGESIANPVTAEKLEEVIDGYRYREMMPPPRQLPRHF